MRVSKYADIIHDQLFDSHSFVRLIKVIEMLLTKMADLWNQEIKRAHVNNKTIVMFNTEFSSNVSLL